MSTYKNVDCLNKISKSKIYNLLKPSKDNTIESSQQKDCLDVKVDVKRSDVSNASFAHEYFAMVSVIHQMCSEFPDKAVFFSCDSKTKVHVGGQAVSRYHQLELFFQVMTHHTIATTTFLYQGS